MHTQGDAARKSEMATVKIALKRRTKGGPGSGNWGHAGRPGLQGGSAPRRDC